MFKLRLFKIFINGKKSNLILNGNPYFISYLGITTAN